MLFVPDGDLVAENDDYEGSPDHSRIQVELESTGEYRVLVTSYEADETGPYELSVIADVAAREARPEVRREQGRLEPGDSDARGRYVDEYTAEWTQGRALRGRPARRFRYLPRSDGTRPAPAERRRGRHRSQRRRGDRAGDGDLPCGRELGQDEEGRNERCCSPRRVVALLPADGRYLVPRVVSRRERSPCAIDDVEPSEAFRFSAAVAEFGLLLHDSDYKGDADYDRAYDRAVGALGDDDDGRRSELLPLIRTARNLAAAAGTGI